MNYNASEDSGLHGPTRPAPKIVFACLKMSLGACFAISRIRIIRKLPREPFAGKPEVIRIGPAERPRTDRLVLMKSQLTASNQRVVWRAKLLRDLATKIIYQADRTRFCSGQLATPPIPAVPPAFYR